MLRKYNEKLQFFSMPQKMKGNGDDPRIIYAMAVIRKLLTEEYGASIHPSSKHPIIIRKLKAEEINLPLESGHITQHKTERNHFFCVDAYTDKEVYFLWTAAMVFGSLSDIRFNSKAIQIQGNNRHGKKFNFKKDEGLFSTFSDTSLYEKKFKRYLHFPPTYTKFIKDRVKIVKDTPLYPGNGIAGSHSIEEQRKLKKEQLLLKYPEFEAKEQELEEKKKKEFERRQEQLKQERLAKENAPQIEMQKEFLRLFDKPSYEITKFDIQRYTRQHSFNINWQDESGNTALIITVSKGYDELAEFLIKNGADPEITNKNSDSAASLVSKQSMLYNIIQDHLRAKYPWKYPTQNEEVSPPTDYEKEPTNNDMNSHFQSDAGLKQDDLKERDKDNKEESVLSLNKALHEETNSITPRARKIKELLDKGADINHQDEQDGYTVLMLAVDNQQDRIAEYLFKQGADPSIKNKYGESASDLALRHSALYELLKEKEKSAQLDKLSPTIKQSRLLHEYVSRPDTQIQKIDDYLNAGADLDYQDGKGVTCVMVALDANNERIAEYLLKKGANPFLINKHGHTAKDFLSSQTIMLQIIKGYELLFATTQNNVRLAQTLLKTDTSIINFQGNYGYTPLHIAVEQDNAELVELFLTYGADLTIPLRDGRGVFELVKSEMIIQLLNAQLDNKLNTHSDSPRFFSGKNTFQQGFEKEEPDGDFDHLLQDQGSDRQNDPLNFSDVSDFYSSTENDNQDTTNSYTKTNPSHQRIKR